MPPTVALPQFAHSVFYAYLIQINTYTVGSIQKMSIKSDRTTERIGEINYNQGLQWKDILWGYESVSIDLSHVEFYQKSLLQLFTNSAVVSLTTMNFAFNILEYQYGHNASVPTLTGEVTPPPVNVAPGATTPLRMITYTGCVPKSFSRTIDRGTIQIIEEMSVECKSVTVVDGNIPTPAAQAG